MTGLLKGKTALITGCLSGIGNETMKLFASHGANIWACALIPSAAFEAEVAALAQAHDVTITPLYFDMADSDSVKTAMKTVIGAKKPVDALLNIAGIANDAIFHMVSMDAARKVFEVNYFSQMLITQYITKLMVRQKSGSVINVSSITATDGNPGQLIYGSTKAAIVGATKTLATELGEHGVRVNAIAPGVINTTMVSKLPAEALARLKTRIPMKRLGEASEVAGVMLFLASDMSRYITGQVLRIDGGIE